MERAVRSRRRSAGRALAVLVALAGLLIPAAPAQAAGPFDVLQLNLCDGGFAPCYSAGRSVDSAIAAIHQRKPAVVTLDEVCAPDITRMTRETGYLWAFAPSRDRATGGPLGCRDGRGDYGVGILTDPDLGAAGQSVTSPYAAQDGANEQRVVLCVPYSRAAACTTQLSPDAAVAARQCQELARTAGGLGPSTVSGGDLALAGPAANPCAPQGWSHADDGGVQHVFGAHGYRLQRSETIPIDGAAHPGLLVEFAR